MHSYFRELFIPILTKLIAENGNCLNEVPLLNVACEIESFLENLGFKKLLDEKMIETMMVILFYDFSDNNKFIYEANFRKELWDISRNVIQKCDK